MEDLVYLFRSVESLKFPALPLTACVASDLCEPWLHCEVEVQMTDFLSLEKLFIYFNWRKVAV